MTHTNLNVFLGIMIASAVLMGSLHISKVIDDHKVLSHDDGSVAKLSVDLHHHSDKSGTSLGDNGVYADGRSLKLHRHHKPRAHASQRLHDWWQLHGLNMS